MRRSIVGESGGRVKSDALAFVVSSRGLRHFPPCAAMPSRADSPSYSISDLAREFALTTRAIRFYEDEGLIAPRRSGQRRIYGERDRVRIKLILRGKRLGLALAEIRELLDLYDATRSERPQLVKFLQVLAQRRALLEQQQEDVAIVLAEIDQLERQCRRRLRQGANGRHGAGASGVS